MPQPSSRSRTFQIFKLILLLVLLTSCAFYVKLLWHLRTDIASGYGDFIIFYTGAQIVKAGMGEHLYDYEIQKAFQGSFKVPIRKGPLPYNHPPFELLIFFPLSSFPYPVAFLIWSAINVVLLGAIFFVINPFLQAQAKVILSVMLLGFYPVFLTIVRGQDSILSTFVLAMTFASLKRQRELLAGLLLAFGLFKPQLIFPTVLILLTKKRWAAMVSFFLGATLLGILSVGLVGWSGILQYGELLLQINRQHYSIYPDRMANIRGFIETVLPQGFEALALIAIALLSLSLLALLLSYWRGSYRPADSLFDLQFSLTLVVTVLTSYHLNSHDLTLLAIPLILTLNHFSTNQYKQGTRSLTFLCLFILLSFPQTYILLYSQDRLSWLVWLVIGLACLLSAEISSNHQHKMLSNQPKRA